MLERDLYVNSTFRFEQMCFHTFIKTYIQLESGIYDVYEDHDVYM